MFKITHTPSGFSKVSLNGKHQFDIEYSYSGRPSDLKTAREQAERMVNLANQAMGFPVLSVV